MTEHELHLSEHSGTYTFNAFAFAIDPATNLSLDITRFGILDLLNGFATSSQSIVTTKVFTYGADNGSPTIEVAARVLEVEISRSELAQAFTMWMFATNWILTLASAYLTFAAVTKGRVDFTVFILHGSMALAIPSIWKLYIGPPPFGASLDVVGFSSQITIVAICSVVLLYAATKSHFSVKVPAHGPKKAWYL